MELLEQTASTEKSPINLKKEIGRYLKKWPWIVLSMLLFYLSAYLYLRYTKEQYLTKSSVKIENLQKGSLGAIENLGGMPMVKKDGAGIEIPIILSRPILLEVVKTLNFDVVFSAEGQIKDQLLYQNAPLEIKILSLNDPAQFYGRSYDIQQAGNQSFSLSPAGGKPKFYPYNTVVNLDFGSIIVKPKAGFGKVKKLQVQLLNAVKVAESLQNAITIQENALNKEILELSHQAFAPDKSRELLDALVSQYNRADLENKKEQSKVSLDFIDERLNVLSNDLGSIENQKEGYKRSNQITDLASQAEMSLQNANENTRQLMEQATQLEMVNSVLNIANRNSKEQLLPTNVGMPAGLDQAISQYNDLIITKNRTLRQATPSNPEIIAFNKEIASLKSLIQDNLLKSKQSIQMNIGRLNGQLNDSKSSISKFPTQEKIFRSIDRQQNLKESLYLFLLQKKEESSIAMAVTMSKVRIVNPAYTLASPVAPLKQQIILGSIFAGLLLPLLIMFVVFTLDTKIKSKNDITAALPNLPILAEVPTVGKDDSDLIGKNELSVYAEAFRILTANVKFILKNPKEAPVILVTSSVKGEGKTTISINSALALASNKKVLLIGADLRNPQLSRYAPKTDQGLSNYLANSEETDYQKFISHSQLHENLDIMDSGTIPPNPTDLLEDKKLGELLNNVKPLYDYILIDSAPMMMVSDSFHILKFADLLVYVARTNYTEKELLTYAKTVSEDDNVKKMGMVLNDVNKNQMRYGYGGKYSYGYTADEEKTGLSRFLDLFKNK